MATLLYTSEDIKIYSTITDTKLELPVALDIKAGFPSPANDFLESGIDLNHYIIKHPSATFYGKVSGDSMIGLGINSGDILVIDRSLEPQEGKIAVCFIDGEFTLKQLHIEKDFILLLPANEHYSPIKVTQDNNFVVWGIVSYVIKKV